MLGAFLRDVIKLNQKPRNFRLFGPDETISNRLDGRLRGDRRGNGTRETLPTMTITSRPRAA